MRKIFAAAALGIGALGLTACATGLPTKVTRYQAAAIPAGASFYVVPPQGAPSPQFYRFASMVSQQLEAKGFKPAGAPNLADMLVKLDYSVDQGKTEYRADPRMGSMYGPYGGGFGWGSRFGRYGWSWNDPFYDPRYGVYYGRPYSSRWGGSPYYYGWDDPFWYGTAWGPRGYGPYGGGYGFDLYTVYKSYLDMDIVQRGNNAPLFDGQAMARSGSDDLNKLVPSLIEAMFTGFPGRNGETVKITVPNEAKR